MQLPAGVTVMDHPLAQSKLAQLRSAESPSAVFRARVCELAELMLFEATRGLTLRSITVRTPLAECAGVALVRPVVLAPILRAGLGMMEGMLRLLPEAGVAHIGMARDERTHQPRSYYFKAPPYLAEADVLVLDPMLATGGSASWSIQQLKEGGARSLRFVCLVSSLQGLSRLSGDHPDVPIFTAAVDPGLDERAYIVPGLGDAGDRYFGTVG